MTLEQTIKEIEQLKQSLRTDLVRDVSRIVSVDIVAMIQKRVVETQRSADGSSFSAYSRKSMLTSGTTLKSRRVWNAVAGSKKKRKELNWVTIKKGGKNIRLFELKGGYAQLRQIEGFTNKNKSFEFTGEMWRKFGVIKTQVTTNGITFTLGGKTTASQDKIDANSEREGRSIIDISQSELNYLQSQIDRLLKGYIAKVNLN